MFFASNSHTVMYPNELWVTSWVWLESTLLFWRMYAHCKYLSVNWELLYFVTFIWPRPFPRTGLCLTQHFIQIVDFSLLCPFITFYFVTLHRISFSPTAWAHEHTLLFEYTFLLVYVLSLANQNVPSHPHFLTCFIQITIEGPLIHCSVGRSHLVVLPGCTCKKPECVCTWMRLNAVASSNVALVHGESLPSQPFGSRSYGPITAKSDASQWRNQLRGVLKRTQTSFMCLFALEDVGALVSDLR